MISLVSCAGCGVVLDKNQLAFPWEIYKEGGVDENLAVWNGKDWVAKADCPVCGDAIPEEDYK